jgi:DNA-binding beta-propeller fold protein YncE
MTLGVPYRHVKTIQLPGAPLAKFDIGWIDEDSRSYYLADRSNSRVVVIDVDQAEFSRSLGAGRFSGASATSGASGPNGVVALRGTREVWAGDGDSTVKILDIDSGDVTDSVATGGESRVDELAYDPQDGIVLVANDKEPVPFVTLISSTGDHAILAKIEFPWASKGLHQPVWSPVSGFFYVPVSEVDGRPSAGEITAVDPRGTTIVARYPIAECQPAGLSLGPDTQLCIGCSRGALVAGFAPRSLIMNILSGEILATVNEVGGSDEVWYNSGTGHYYLAAASMTGGPVLGIVDAETMTWIQNVPTGEDSRSVAADPRTKRVFVPVIPGALGAQGGVAVFELSEQ